MVRTIHEHLRRRCPRFTIRLDGNQGFTERSCLKLLGRLERAGIAIELLEQPLPKDDRAGLKRITEFLRAQGFHAVSNITGGIDAWATVIDPDMRRY